MEDYFLFIYFLQEYLQSHKVLLHAVWLHISLGRDATRNTSCIYSLVWRAACVAMREEDFFPHYHCQQLQSHATFKNASESDISKLKKSCFVCISCFPGVQWGMLYGTFILVLIAQREGGKHLNKAIIEEERKLMLQQHHLLHIAWRHLPRKKVRHKEFINLKSKGSLPFSFCYFVVLI